MKKWYTFLLVCCITAAGYAQFTKTTITAIQQVPLDSLKKADSLGIGAGSSWNLQVSPMNGQKVEVTALVVIPPRIITYTARGRAMVVCDTGAAMNQPWSHIFVRYSGSETSFDANGFNSLQAGDIVTLRGKLSEFPTVSMNSLTQFDPDTLEAVNIISSNNPLPTVPLMSITDFNTGANPGGHVNIITGESYESQGVMFTDLTVTAIVNATRGTWAVTDANGNTLSMYDWSYHFTLDTSGTDRTGNPHDVNYKVPPVGTKVDTIRGFISTSSGGESSRGYRICPIYPEDVKFGAALPGISTHRRYPVVPSKDSNVTVQAKIYQQFGGDAVASAALVYKVDNGSWTEVAMTAAQASVDSLYSAVIPKQSAGSFVYYFVKATDASAHTQILANTGNLTQYDSSQGTFFYKVYDRATTPVLSIRDIQYTPFRNGRTPFLGAVDSVGGIVTADTSSLVITAIGSAGTSAWYIQSTNQPYSGIYVLGPDSVMTKLHLGDSVIVTGTVQENFDVTRISATAARIVASGKTAPSPVVLTTNVFGPAATSGDFGAEPYEGMLVKFNNVTVSNINPTFVDPTEFEISSAGEAAVLVRRDGRNTFSNVQSDSGLGYRILHAGDMITSLTGIIYYNNNRYKIVPRTNADYDVPLSVHEMPGTVLPKEYALEQNYPNPFNPSTTIRYSVPANAMVSLKIYNIIGQEVATLVNTEQHAGNYSATFDASKLASGIYLYKLTAGHFTQVKKMMLLK